MDVILNWIWQGLVIAGATTVALVGLRRGCAQARYIACWAAMAAVLILPVVSIAWTAAPAAPAPVLLPAAASAPLLTIPATWWTSGTAAGGLWLLWSAIAAVRVGLAALALGRARAGARPLPAVRLARLPRFGARAAEGRPARVVVSARVRSAAVLGFGAPVIVVAPALLERLTDEELDRVLVHEWAHVQRWDDVALAMQMAIRVVAGWHPALWWLDRRLHLEREMACDEATVAMTGSARGYAACLARLASLPAGHARPLPAVAALTPSDLRRRVVRILAPRRPSGPVWRAASMTALWLGACAATVGGVSLVGAHVAPVAAAELDAVVGRLAAPIGAERALTAPAPGGDRVDVARAVARGRTGDAPPRARASAVLPARAALAHTAQLAAPPVVAPTPVADTDAAGVSSVPLVPTPPPLAALAPDVPASPAAPAAGADDSPTPWSAAADGGKAIGRASQKAAEATAGFFTRFGRKIAGQF